MSTINLSASTIRWQWERTHNVNLAHRSWAQEHVTLVCHHLVDLRDSGRLTDEKIQELIAYPGAKYLWPRWSEVRLELLGARAEIRQRALQLYLDGGP